ncbi:PREDICTED: uncharacterized protein LOC109381434 [Hipposideros armiger]|uniref:Uncharacterized protein LOC109381434 n=1 Tax=Hipposideros armiger TaxID=186990 RepID=A0A8B7R7E5_HIPAR|nr:PREDICTED: uncharacterized protein LOC109381434 [Hipposideros armiger]
MHRAIMIGVLQQIAASLLEQDHTCSSHGLSAPRAGAPLSNHVCSTAEQGPNTSSISGWQPLLFPSCVYFEKMISPIRKFIARINQSFSVIYVEEQPLHGALQSTLGEVPFGMSHGSKYGRPGCKMMDLLVHLGSWVCNYSPSQNLMVVKRDKRIQVIKFRNHDRPGRKPSACMLLFYWLPSLFGEEFTFHGGPSAFPAREGHIATGQSGQRLGSVVK